MRATLFALLLLPTSLTAEVFTLPSRATDAMIYQGLAKITHSVAVTLPAGQHQLVFPDLPRSITLDQLQVVVEGLVVSSMRFRNDLAPPRADTQSPEIEAAKARIKEVEGQIEAVLDTARRNELTAEAAEARIAFLAALGRNESLPQNATALGEIADLIATQTLTAKQTAFDARLNAREDRAALADLQDDLARAQAALAALVPEAKERAYLVLDVTAGASLENEPLALSYYASKAFWQPTYEYHLRSAPTPAVVVTRGARVFQETGENWQGVRLSLSTQAIGQTSPSALFPDRRRIEDPAPKALSRSADVSSMAAPAMDTPVIVEEAAAGFDIETQGLALVYNFPNPVDIANETDDVALTLDTLTLDAEIFARATPLRDETGFVMARFTNDSPEPILPSYESRLFFDGGLVGVDVTDAIAQGEEVEMGFGPILGLQVKRTVLTRAEGDRGIITKSNEQSLQARIDVTNLTDRAWDLELRDSVPFSEQEDLVITYTTSPRPDIAGVDDKRGILQWNLDMPAGTHTQVTTSYDITWPDGMILR